VVYGNTVQYSEYAGIIVGGLIPSPSGKTEDYGFAITALNGKVAFKVNRYETSVSNATLSGELGNAYLIGAGEAWGQAAAVQLKANSGNWPGDGNYGTTSAGSKFGAGNILRWQPADAGNLVPDSQGRQPGSTGYQQTYSQISIDRQYDIQRASTDDWLAKPVPASFQSAWGMTGYATGSGNWSMNSVAVTGDTLSKGTEFELAAQPIDGLDLSINASKTTAKRLSIGKAYSDWIEKRLKDYAGPMGDMRLWGNGNWALEKHPMEMLYGYSVVADLRPGTRYDEVVRALGGHGELVSTPAELRPALRRAFDSGVPAVVNTLTDPGVAYPRRSNLA
jgi:hypothetical protein